MKPAKQGSNHHEQVQELDPGDDLQRNLMTDIKPFNQWSNMYRYYFANWLIIQLDLLQILEDMIPPKVCAT